MALEETLACPRSFGETPQSLHPHLDWWSEESNVLRGQPLHPLQHALQLFTDASNEGWGAHLGDSTARGVWSPPRKSPPHKLSRVEGSPSGAEEFRTSLQGPDCSGCNGQHNGGLLHKQTGRYEIRLSLCPSLETPVLVSPQGNKSKGSPHPRSVECDSGQTIQTQSADTNRVVPLSAGV